MFYSGHVECVHLLEGHSISTNDHTSSGPTDLLEMSMAEAYVSLYNDTDVTCVTQLSDSDSDYNFTPSPPHQSTTHNHTFTCPSPRAKLMFSPPSTENASDDSCYQEHDSLLYTTAVDESLALDMSRAAVGGVRGGATSESPLNGTFIVEKSYRDSDKNSKDHYEPEQPIDLLCDSVSKLTTSTHQSRQTCASCCFTPSPMECSFVADIKVQIPVKLKDMTDSQLRERLVALGEKPGPITPSTKVAYLAYLAKLEAGVQPTGNKGYKGERGKDNYRWYTSNTHCILTLCPYRLQIRVSSGTERNGSPA